MYVRVDVTLERAACSDLYHLGRKQRDDFLKFCTFFTVYDS